MYVTKGKVNHGNFGTAMDSYHYKGSPQLLQIKMVYNLYIY